MTGSQHFPIQTGKTNIVHPGTPGVQQRGIDLRRRLRQILVWQRQHVVVQLPQEPVTGAVGPGTK